MMLGENLLSVWVRSVVNVCLKVVLTGGARLWQCAVVQGTLLDTL